MRPKWVRIICDLCGTLSEIESRMFAMIRGDGFYQGIICIGCGGLLIINKPGVRGKDKAKKIRRKKPSEPKWKIIYKGKIDIHAPRSRHAKNSRRIKKGLQR